MLQELLSILVRLLLLWVVLLLLLLLLVLLSLLLLLFLWVGSGLKVPYLDDVFSGEECSPPLGVLLWMFGWSYV